MKNIIVSFFILVISNVSSKLYSNNVSDYVFTQSTETYTTIHTTGTYITGGCTSSVFGNLPIGFTFVYNGTPYTQFGLCCSGWISLGAGAPATSIYPLSSGSTNNVISPFAAQLSSTVAGDGIFYKTEGTAPDRILTVEWWLYGFWFNGFDEICFQIKLYETSNKISFVYTTNDVLSIRTIQVGIRGASNSDFNNRQTTTNWTQTTAGTTNTASCLYQAGITPPSGLTFNFMPPITAIVKIDNLIPDNFKLYQNYPNPFNPITKIKFDVAKLSDVKIVVYDVMGREVQTIVNERLQPGTYETKFDGSKLNSGVYFYKLTAENYTEVKKFLMIK